jgi:hypothetical protein
MLLTRCGFFPSDSTLGITSNRFTDNTFGPYWSPDCRNITWAINHASGVGRDNGIYVFNEKNQQTKLIFSLPQSTGGSDFITLTGWKDSENIIFLLGINEKKSQIINITDQTVDSLEKITSDTPSDLTHPEGYIYAVYQRDNSWYLDIDLVRLYFGESSKNEAVRDGVCTSVEKCFWPNGFAIRNLDDVKTTFQISPTAKIDLSELEPYRNSWSDALQDFEPLFKVNPSLTELSHYFNNKSSSHIDMGAFRLTISESVVTQIDGVYIP